MGPAALKELLQSLPAVNNPAGVLIGMDTVDDAGVYQINKDQAIVQTVDYFTPIVDEGKDFGKIAAANSLSDLYAMGATPITALNIAGFPAGKLPLQILSDILAGGQEKVEEAGAAILGGHTVDDAEPKYGLSVTGMVHPEKIITKKGARPGDILILTKPIGVGILTTGIKRGKVEEPQKARAVKVMETLNNDAAEIFCFDRVTAMTDVTGFGLLGHLLEMLNASRVGARIKVTDDLFIEGSERLATQEIVPGGTKKNLDFLNPHVSWKNISRARQYLLADAMTSGGLLAAVKPEYVDEVVKKLKVSSGISAILKIGEIIPDESKIIVE